MLKRMAIVIRDDAFDRLYTPLTFAYVAARDGVRVDILFVLWAVKVLTAEGAQSVTIDPQHADDEQWFKERLRHDGDPPTIADFVTQLKQAGDLHFYGCRLAAATFGVQGVATGCRGRRNRGRAVVRERKSDGGRPLPVFLSRRRPKRIVCTQQFCDEQGKLSRHSKTPTWPATMLTTVRMRQVSSKSISRDHSTSITGHHSTSDPQRLDEPPLLRGSAAGPVSAILPR
jgi:peroxiredoxin family protein